jgi:hypothetical protein
MFSFRRVSFSAFWLRYSAVSVVYNLVCGPYVYLFFRGSTLILNLFFYGEGSYWIATGPLGIIQLLHYVSLNMIGVPLQSHR